MHNFHMADAGMDRNKIKSSTLRQYLKVIEHQGIKAGFTPGEQKANKEKTDKILAKLKAGKKLTSAEMTYLQRTDFLAYIHALRVQKTRENLVTTLKHARSKTQAKWIIARALGTIDKRDPDREYLTAAIRDVAEKFQKSSAYRQLPETDRDAGKKRRENHFADKSDKDDDETGLPGYETDLETEDIVAGEPIGNYQIDFPCGSVEIEDLAKEICNIDMTG